MNKRIYFFEVFTILNFAALEVVLRRIGLSAFTLLGSSFLFFGPALLLQALLGIGIRAAVGRRRGDDYLALIRAPRFATDVLRMIVTSVLWAHIYGWLKVAVPALHPVLYDQQLWDLDRALCFGFSPNVFFLHLFSSPLALRAVDWTYANVFAAGLFITGAFFLSSPDARLRIGFINSRTLMWLAGAWIYVVFPSLGPAYAFPSLWLPLAPYLTQTQFLQRLLMANYQKFLQLGQGQPATISLLLGIGAFPSLHVAAVFHTFLWIRGAGRGWQLLFAVLAAIIFLGSLVTGWHYLVDALAGLALAALCFTAFRLLPMRLRQRHAHAD